MMTPTDENSSVYVHVSYMGDAMKECQKGNLGFSSSAHSKGTGVHWAAVFDFGHGSGLRCEAFSHDGLIRGCLSCVSTLRFQRWQKEGSLVCIAKQSPSFQRIVEGFARVYDGDISKQRRSNCRAWVLALIRQLDIAVRDELKNFAEQTLDCGDDGNKAVADTISIIRRIYEDYNVSAAVEHNNTASGPSDGSKKQKKKKQRDAHLASGGKSSKENIFQFHPSAQRY